MASAAISRFWQTAAEERICSHSGAVCQNMLIAADAMGYGANWITDWYSYDERATRLLGLEPQERVAGFVHLGTLPEPPQERVRPEIDKLVTVWNAPPSEL